MVRAQGVDAPPAASHCRSLIQLEADLTHVIADMTLGHCTEEGGAEDGLQVQSVSAHQLALKILRV
ncbi:MAG: hypothetical protein AAF913_01505 [Pseudomonadota bacterium]